MPVAVRETKVSVTLCHTTGDAFERFMPVPVTIVTPRKTQSCLSGPTYRVSSGDRVKGITYYGLYVHTRITFYGLYVRAFK